MQYLGRVSVVLVIREVQIAEFDLPAKLQVRGNGRVDITIVDRRFSLEQLIDADNGCGSALEKVDNPPQSDDRPGQHHQISIKGDKITHADAMRQDFMAADKKRNRHSQPKNKFEGW